MFEIQNNEIEQFVFLTRAIVNISCFGANEPEAAMKSEAIIETQKAERYLKQLCKHFQHKVPAGFDDQTGWIDLPMGCAELLASGQALKLSLTADTAEQMEKMEDVVQRHLERFAFREDLKIKWQLESVQ